MAFPPEELVVCPGWILRGLLLKWRINGTDFYPCVSGGCLQFDNKLAEGGLALAKTKKVIGFC